MQQYRSLYTITTCANCIVLYYEQCTTVSRDPIRFLRSTNICTSAGFNFECIVCCSRAYPEFLYATATAVGPARVHKPVAAAFICTLYRLISTRRIAAARAPGTFRKIPSNRVHFSPPGTNATLNIHVAAIYLCMNRAQ